MKGPGRDRPGEPGWADGPTRHEVGVGPAPGAEPLNFTLVIDTPTLDRELAALFKEWLDGLSPADRSLIGTSLLRPVPPGI